MIGELKKENIDVYEFQTEMTEIGMKSERKGRKEKESRNECVCVCRTACSVSGFLEMNALSQLQNYGIYKESRAEERRGVARS